MSVSLIGRSLGKTQIVSLLGQGGMATVYKGYQPDVDRYVAVKVLPPHPARDPGFVERFKLEARTVARLQHPHIVPLYDYGTEANDIFYLVTAFIDGGSLNERIHQYEGVPGFETADLLRQIAPALDYAHRSGVIHRDIKPDNILLDREGNALLADFGIVKLVEGTTATLTATGGLLGTPAYMSPEQAQGLPLDPRSDIYSLGIVVFEMLTGKQPYSADTTMQIVLKQIQAPVPTLLDYMPNATLALDDVLRRALAKNPADRYQSATAFAEAFNAAITGQVAAVPRRVNTPNDATTIGVVDNQNQSPQSPTSSVSPTYGASSSGGVAPSTPTPIPTVTPTSPLASPAVLIPVLAIMVLLVVIILLLLLRPTTPSVAVVPTENAVTVPTSIATEASSAPTVDPAIATPLNTLQSLPSVGRALFSSTNAPGDTVNIAVEGLAPPSNGSPYQVSLVGIADSLPIGTLALDALGNGQLTYTDVEGRFLPALFNQLIIGQDEGTAAYAGAVPPQVTDAIAAILISTNLPAEGARPAYEGSLLNGALAEARIAQQHAGLAAESNSVNTMHLHAEHTINILNGTLDDYDGSGRGENPGRGYGIGYFLDRIEVAIDTAANVTGTSDRVQDQLEFIRICAANARADAAEVDSLERQIVVGETLESEAARLTASTEAAASLVSGLDFNGRNGIEPFENECGLEQIAAFGVSAANMDIYVAPAFLEAMRALGALTGAEATEDAS